MTRVWSTMFNQDTDNSIANSHSLYKFSRPDSGYQSFSQMFLCDSNEELNFDNESIDNESIEVFDDAEDTNVSNESTYQSDRVSSLPIPIPGSNYQFRRNHMNPSTDSPSTSISSTSSSSYLTSSDHHLNFFSQANNSMDLAGHPPCYCGCLRGYRPRYQDQRDNQRDNQRLVTLIHSSK